MKIDVPRMGYSISVCKLCRVVPISKNIDKIGGEKDAKVQSGFNSKGNNIV